MSKSGGRQTYFAVQVRNAYNAYILRLTETFVPAAWMLEPESGVHTAPEQAVQSASVVQPSSTHSFKPRGRLPPELQICKYTYGKHSCKTE